MEDVIDHWPQITAIVSQERETLEVELAIVIHVEKELGRWALGKSKLDIKVGKKILELCDVKVCWDILIGDNEPITTNSDDIREQWNGAKDILPFVLNTKRPLSNIRLLRYKQNSFGCFQRNSEVKFFLKNTQNCFAYISVTKYRSEAVLYTKRTARYPLWPYIKTIAVAFFQAE